MTTMSNLVTQYLQDGDGFDELHIEPITRKVHLPTVPDDKADRDHEAEMDALERGAERNER